MEKLEMLITVTVLGCLILGAEVSAFYVKRSMIPKSPELEAEVQSYIPAQYQNDLDDASLERFSRGNDDSPAVYPPPQKRYLCRKHFVYNPVKGRCQPTMLGWKIMSRKYPRFSTWNKRSV